MRCIRLCCLVVCVAAALLGCSNPETPAGYEGYVTKSPWFGSSRFYASQTGPNSTGMGWLLSARNVDMRWSTRDEDFQVMTVDDLQVQFTAHLVIRPRPGSIRLLVEGFGGEDWYARVIKQPYRNAVQISVAGYRALEVKERRHVIADHAYQQLLTYLDGKPFDIQTMVIGDILFPKVVAEAQAEKVRKQTLLDQKDSEVAIAKKDAAIRVIQAEGIAQAQGIISGTLTQSYLQHEAIEAQKSLAGSPNHTTIYIPSGAMGVPLTFTESPQKR